MEEEEKKRFNEGEAAEVYVRMLAVCRPESKKERTS